jgi:hypothetical protein
LGGRVCLVGSTCHGGLVLCMRVCDLLSG